MMKAFKKLVKLPAKGREAIQQLTFARLFFKLANNPNDTQVVFKLADIVYGTLRRQNPAEIARQLRASTVYQEALAEKYRPAPYQIADLATYAPGTLGQAYYQHMTSNGFQKDFYPDVALADDLSYIEQRLRETHDIWHVVTGYGTDVAGEVALLAFYLGQAKDEDPFPLIIIAAALIYSALHERAKMGDFIRQIYAGYNRGYSAQNFYPVKWEELWHRPLSEIQASLGLTAVRRNEPALLSV